jgi:uncharacterized protein (TIGR03067 family)
MRLAKMIQFAFGFIEFAVSRRGSAPRDQSYYGILRGISMMFGTNRMALRAPAMGLSLVLTLATGIALNMSWGAASARGDEKSQADLIKPLLGTWASSGEGLDATWTFENDKVKANVAGMEYTCKPKIDADAKPFATIDLVIDDGPEEAKGKTSKGIYKIDGEKLTLCVSAPGKDRPKEFAQTDDEAYLFELKKEKKKD